MTTDPAAILVVDDDAGVRNLYREVLSGPERRVLATGAGREALETLARETVALVILDLKLADMDGFDFLARVKEQLEDPPPVIVSSGMASVDNAVRAIKAGAADFVIKPFNIAALEQIVARTIRLSTLEEEISELRMNRTVLKLSRMIVSISELDRLLERVIRLVDEFLSPDRAALYLRAGDDRPFILRKQRLRGDESGVFPVTIAGAEVAGLCADRYLDTVAGDGRTTVRAAIRGKESVLGLLVFDLPPHRTRLKLRETRFIEAFATQVGIGVENARLLEIVGESYMNAIRSLINSLEAKDAYTKGHSDQVAYYAHLIARELGFDEERLATVRNAGHLHDLGKLGIKDRILLKPGPLDEGEYEVIRMHPRMTVDILEPLNMDKEELEACLRHHERVDGSGYPGGLKDAEIPLYARILAVADAFSAMTSRRTYRTAMDGRAAVGELRRNSGSQFDPAVVDAFVRVFERTQGAPEPAV